MTLGDKELPNMLLSWFLLTIYLWACSLPHVGFTSVFCEYVLLLLVNKEAALAYGRAEYSKAENPSRDRGRKKVGSKRCHVAAKREKCQHQLATA